MASTMLEMISLRSIGENYFESMALPERMGNTANIAFGGCTLSMVVSAAFQTLDASRGRLAFYSALGHFVGPALTDRAVRLRVTSLRDTRTFATRQVIASQEQTDGSERNCISAQLDFIASPTDDPEVHTFLRYSVPSPKTTNPAHLPLFHEYINDRVLSGDLHRDVQNAYNSHFELLERLFEGKAPPDSPLSENVLGIDKTRKTSQDHLRLTSKRAVDFIRLRQTDLSSQSAPASHALPVSQICLHFASLAFALDAAIAFVPLSLSYHFLPDVAACSSLDFALRFHTDTLDMGNWHTREMRTMVGDYGRTYNESMVWDKEGRLVATMNQQSILRPHSRPVENFTRDAKL